MVTRFEPSQRHFRGREKFQPAIFGPVKTAGNRLRLPRGTLPGASAFYGFAGASDAGKGTGRRRLELDPRFRQSWPRLAERATRIWTASSWRWLNLRPDRMVSMVGGAQLRYPAREAEFFSSHPNALVLVGRCDLTGLTRFRQPGQRWVLDSNDSVSNLEDTYGLAERWRRLNFIKRESWMARLRADELKLARNFDRIICMSRDDEQFFAAVAPGKISFEDTCVVLPAERSPVPVAFDIGYLGGNGEGATIAGENLVELAGRPEMRTFRFGIAGRVCGQLAHRQLPANVVLSGTVDDSLGFLRQCRCMVLFAGPETGVSVKFQESLGAGCIVIANRHAARHSLARVGETHLEANTLEEVARLLSSGDVWKFKPKSITAHFSRAAFHQRFSAALDGPGHG